MVTAYLAWGTPHTSPCLTRDMLVAAVEARLERPVFVEKQAADVHLAATLVLHGEDLMVELALRDRFGAALGTREVHSRGPDCGGLADNLPLVVALLIDLPRRDVPPPLVAELAPTPSVAPPSSISRAPRRPSSRPTLRVSAALALDLSYGLLPGLGLGEVLQSGITTARGWGLELAFGALGPSYVRPAGARGEARFVRLAAGALSCAPLWRGRVFFAVCAGMDVGPMLARGAGFDRNLRRARVLAEVNGGLRAQLKLVSALFARLDAGLSVPMWREEYVFRSETGARVHLHEPAPLLPRFAIGVGLWLR